MLFGIVTRPWGVTVVIIDDLGLLPRIIVPGLILVNQRPTVAGPGIAHHLAVGWASFSRINAYIRIDSVCIDRRRSRIIIAPIRNPGEDIGHQSQ